jgi:hypothetical protein
MLGDGYQGNVRAESFYSQWDQALPCPSCFFLARASTRKRSEHSLQMVISGGLPHTLQTRRACSGRKSDRRGAIFMFCLPLQTSRGDFLERRKSRILTYSFCWHTVTRYRTDVNAYGSRIFMLGEIWFTVAIFQKAYKYFLARILAAQEFLGELYWVNLLFNRI